MPDLHSLLSDCLPAGGHAALYGAHRLVHFQERRTPVRQAAKECGITVLRVPAYSPYAVAEHAMAILQEANRRLHKAYTKVKDNNFALSGLLGLDLHNKVAGIMGTGKIGQCMARICKGYGMTVLGWDAYPNQALVDEGLLTYVSKEELLKRADLISLHCPLIMGDNGTYHLINDEKNGAGIYSFNVRALSPDITVVANSARSTDRPRTNIATTASDIADTLKGWNSDITDGTTTASAVRFDVINNINTAELAASMVSTDTVRDEVEKLEDSYKTSTGITVTTEVSADAQGTVSTDGMQIIGAGLNAVKDNDKVKVASGVVSGKEFDFDQLKTLSTLPSYETLLTQLAAGMLGTLTQLSIGLNMLTEEKEA